MRAALVPLALALVLGMPARADEDLVGAWSLDGPYTDGVADSSGGGHHGVAKNGAAPRSGAAAFPNMPGCATCAVIEVDGDLGVGRAAGLTAEAWVKWTIDPRAGTPRAVILSQSSALTGVAGTMTPDAGLFWLRAAGDVAHPAFQFGVRVGSQNVFVTGMTVGKPGVWAHVAGVYDGAQVKLYVNGELEGSTAASGAVAPMRPEYRLVVGAAPFDEGGAVGRRAFTGEVDEVRVTTLAKNGAQLRASACDAGPQAALASFCSVAAAPMCTDCMDLTLTATRWYSPARELAGSRQTCRAIDFTIPPRLTVTGGNGTGGSAVLSFQNGVNGSVLCTYDGATTTYALSSCTNGALGGQVARADQFALRGG